jgi:hypothetical protein
MRFKKSKTGVRHVEVGRVMGIKSGEYFILSAQNGTGNLKFSKLYKYGELVKIPAEVKGKLTKEERALVDEIRDYVKSTRHRPRKKGATT